MKNLALLAILTVLLLATGCATTQQGPSTPEPQPDQYALQVLRIEIPIQDLSIQSLTTRQDIDAMLQNPESDITEFPIVYAGIGETAINDQTETISAPKSYEPKTNANGVVSVVYSDDTAKVGQYVEMTLQKVENGTATCDLWSYEQTLQGMQTYNVAPATETQATVTASLPIFRKNELRTKINLALGSWLPMGGVIREKAEDFSSGKAKEGEKTTTSISTWTRILPPKDMTIEPPAPDGPVAPATRLETTNLHPENPTL